MISDSTSFESEDGKSSWLGGPVTFDRRLRSERTLRPSSEEEDDGPGLAWPLLCLLSSSRTMDVTVSVESLIM